MNAPGPKASSHASATNRSATQATSDTTTHTATSGATYSTTDSLAQAIETQQALLTAVMSDRNPAGFDEAGLSPYRRGLKANATRALSVSFPTVYQLVGAQQFAALTERYLQFAPPNSGDWGLWGATLAQLLPAIDALANYPYLADCAALDWACHQAERCADATLQTQTLALLEQDPSQIALIPGMGLSVIESNYPIVSIYQAHQQGEERAKHDMTAAREKLVAGEGENALIWRQQWKAKAIAISNTNAYWLQCVRQNNNLEECLDAMAQSSFAFEQWLPEAIQQGWVLGVRMIDN